MEVENTNVECNAICTRDKFTLIDRVNEKIRVMTDLFCRSHILNPVPLNLFDEISTLKEIGIKTFRFDFRDENYEEVKKVLICIKIMNLMIKVITLKGNLEEE